MHVHVHVHVHAHAGAGARLQARSHAAGSASRLHLTRAQRELSLVARRSCRRAHGTAAAAAAAGLHGRGDERVVRAAAQGVESLVG